MSLTTNDVLRVIDKMIETKDEDYTLEIVDVNDSLKLEINCIRLCKQNGVMSGAVGEAVTFEIYAVREGVSVDCVTIDASDDFNEDVSYLLNCYS